MLHELFCAILAAIWCSLITPSIRRGALQLGAFDEPGGRRVHRERAPRLGGLAVFLAGASALLVGSLLGPALGTTYVQQHLGQPGLVCGALIILATGVMDDLWNLSPRTKLADVLSDAEAWSQASVAMQRLAIPHAAQAVVEDCEALLAA